MGKVVAVKDRFVVFRPYAEQIARHAGVDLEIGVRGDLKVDEHHTVEDTAIVLGECFAKALGSKKGIERYGFALPMDDAKAEVLLDFGGRTWLEWGVTLKREYVGDFPTEMARIFLLLFVRAGSAICISRPREKIRIIFWRLYSKLLPVPYGRLSGKPEEGSLRRRAVSLV